MLGRKALFIVLIVFIGLSQLASVHTWLKPHSPAPKAAAIIEAKSRPTDLILITQTPLASSFNFYYQGTLEQWAVPFQENVTHVPWRDFFQRINDAALMSDFERDLRKALDEGRRIWVLSGKDMPISSDFVRDTKGRLETFPSYLKAMLTFHCGLLEILYRYAHPIYRFESPDEDYWEKFECVLFDPVGA